MPAMPDVTVIIPAYNRLWSLPDANSMPGAGVP